MVDSLASLKRSRESALAKLTKEVSKLASPQGAKQEDPRFWQPDVDKSGNGYAIIRFLPSPPGGDDVPWVRIWSHGFKGPGGWYIENSLTTLGQADPVSELNTALWNKSPNTKDDVWKKQARDQKRKLVYISNILVVKDTANPENEGKVFLYKYGKKVFDKINALMNPKFEDDVPVNPFDFWNGCNLRLKIRTVEGYRNYDMSEFASPSPVAETDEEIEKIWKSEYSLSEFLDPSQFKSYTELKARLDRALGLVEAAAPVMDDFDDTPKVAAPKLGKTKPAEADDDLDFFRSLAEED